MGFWEIAVLVTRPANDRPVGRAPWSPGSLVDRNAACRGARPSEPRLARLSGSTRRPRIARRLRAQPMKAIRMHGRGGPDQLVYGEGLKPHHGPGELLERIRAAEYIHIQLHC